MAASHIAVRARSYGSFPVSAAAHDETWLRHAQERITQRRALDARQRVAQLLPEFLAAFPVLRGALRHSRAQICACIALRQFERGSTISSENTPALVFLISGMATNGGAVVSAGEGVGEEALWGEPAVALEAASRTCSALVLDVMLLKESVSGCCDADFEKSLLPYRAWHRGLGENSGAQEVKDFVSSLVNAASLGDAGMIRNFAAGRENLLDVADPGSREGGALHIASMKGEHSCLDTLLGLGASANARGGSGQTPLHAAALVGDAFASKKLLEAKANPNNSDAHLRTPLHVAAQEGHIDVVKALLASGAKVDVQDSRLSTPAHLACAWGNPTVVKALLLAGCNLKKKDHHKWNVWNTARQWQDGHGNSDRASLYAAVYDMVNLVWRREKGLTDWGHPCEERDRTYLEMPEPEPEPEPAPAPAPSKPSFNLV